MTRTDADAIVVGGGPAGSAAAITLARAGRRVVLVDRAEFPRDKTCGDGLTALALRRLDHLGLDPAVIPSWRPVERLSIRSPSGRWVRLGLPEGRGLYGAVASRLDLDAALLDLARSAGAELHLGTACTASRFDAAPGRPGTDSCVEVTLADGTRHRAAYLVGADGMWSPTRRQLGIGHESGYRGEMHAFRQYFTGVSGRAANELIVWFEPDLLPGYAWSFPLEGGRANVGFALWRNESYRVGALGRLWPEVLARSHISSVLGPGARPEEAARAWPIPARIDRTTYSYDRALWVGDAIGACDPMTGEGIAQAIETGTWAAEAIVRHGHEHPDLVRGDYERQVRQGLVADHRMAMALVRALRHRKGNRLPLWLVDRNDWTRRNFARWLWEDYPRGLVVTPGRWRRGVLDAPGAFRGSASSEPASSSC